MCVLIIVSSLAHICSSSLFFCLCSVVCEIRSSRFIHRLQFVLIGIFKKHLQAKSFFFLELIDHLFIIIKIYLFDVARLSYKSSPSGQLKAARCALLCIFSRWFSLWLFWSSHHTPALVLRRSFSVPFIIFTGHQLLQFSPQRILSCTYEDDAIAEQQRSAVPRSDRRLLLLEKELDNV